MRIRHESPYALIRFETKGQRVSVSDETIARATSTLGAVAETIETIVRFENDTGETGMMDMFGKWVLVFVDAVHTQDEQATNFVAQLLESEDFRGYARKRVELARERLRKAHGR